MVLATWIGTVPCASNVEYAGGGEHPCLIKFKSLGLLLRNLYQKQDYSLSSYSIIRYNYSL